MLKLAILTTSSRAAIDWLRKTYGDRATLISRTALTGKIRTHNVDRDFVIISTEERLRGIELMGFEVVGNVSSGMVHLAQLRVRS